MDENARDLKILDAPPAVDCAHAQSITTAGVSCALGLYGGLPSPGRCARCEQRQPVGNAQTIVIRPGDLIELVLRAMGFAQGADCRCKQMQAWMNAIGWTGCLLRRRQITAWFVAKARGRGIDADEDHVWLLISRTWESGNAH